MNSVNKAVLDKGFAKALKMIEDSIFTSLWDSAVNILRFLGVIHPMQGWKGFTGNTQTSYACGIYIDGHLEGVVTQDNWHEPTRRRKVEKGKWVYLKNPYEGEPRAVKGQVDIQYNHGLNTSLEFLQSYKCKRNHIGLVVTTGTEYSEYLETVRHLDVLTRTFIESPGIINANWTKIGGLSLGNTSRYEIYRFHTL